MSNLIKVDTSKAGMPQPKAEEIFQKFAAETELVEVLEDDYNAIMNEVITEETCEKAKDLLKEYAGIRKNVTEIHKEEKAGYLKAGQFIDQCKREFLAHTDPKETRLKEIRDYFKIIEEKKQAALKIKRESRIRELGFEPTAYNLNGMEENAWDALEKGLMLQADEREKERVRAVEAEKARQAEYEATKAENERLAKENAEKEAELAKERKEKEALEEKIATEKVEKEIEAIEPLEDPAVPALDLTHAKDRLYPLRMHLKAFLSFVVDKEWVGDEGLWVGSMTLEDDCEYKVTVKRL